MYTIVMNFLKKINLILVIVGQILVLILGYNFSLPVPIFFLFFLSILYLGFSKDKFKKVDIISFLIGGLITQILLWL